MFEIVAVICGTLAFIAFLVFLYYLNTTDTNYKPKHMYKPPKPPKATYKYKVRNEYQ